MYLLRRRRPSAKRPRRCDCYSQIPSSRRLAPATVLRAWYIAHFRNRQFGDALLSAIVRRKRIRGRVGELAAGHNRELRAVWGPTHPNLDAVHLQTDLSKHVHRVRRPLHSEDLP